MGAEFVSYFRFIALEGSPHVGGAFGDFDAGRFEGGDFFGGGAFAAGDDRAGVAHALAGGSSLAGDEGGHRLGDVLLGERGGFFFGGAADFAHHEDGFGLVVGLVELQEVDEGRADDRVAAEADASGLAEAEVRELPDGFVGERAAAAHDADGALLVDVAGHDADFAFLGRDDAGAVGADRGGRHRVFDDVVDADHVDDGDAFGDRDDDFAAGVDGFEDGVGGEGRRDEDHGGVDAFFFDGFGTVSKTGTPRLFGRPSLA